MGVNHTSEQQHSNVWRQAEKQAGRRGVVVQYSNHELDKASHHESVTRACIADKLAALKGYEYAGEYDAATRHEAPLYFVPSDTIVGIKLARDLGVAGEGELFGGVVPYPFVATKTITHPLVNSNACAPEGWSRNFARRVQDAVLFGFAAFTFEDTRLACARVLERGLARLKPARGVGGRGQKVITSLGELDRAMDGMDPAELSRYGVAIEENLEEVTTYSIGKVRVEELCVSYCGTQRLTSDHSGASVYGGSDLLVVRGGFEVLLGFDLAPELRQAVARAHTYDTAATEEFPGLIASRRNYDVAEGRDRDGRRVLGVLEQSWRIGGASPAEVAALQAFREQASLDAVLASCTEVYDARHEPPARALVHFCGEDDRVGSIVKYTLVEPYGNSR